MGKRSRQRPKKRLFSYKKHNGRPRTNFRQPPLHLQCRLHPEARFERGDRWYDRPYCPECEQYGVTFTTPKLVVMNRTRPARVQPTDPYDNDRFEPERTVSVFEPRTRPRHG